MTTTTPPPNNLVVSDQERLFQLYLAMGPGRSHSKLQKLVSENPNAYGLAYSPSLRNIKQWSSFGQWSRRIRDPEGLEREKAERQRREQMEAFRDRLRQRGFELQERGNELLRGVPGNGVTLKEAVAAVDMGLRYQASSLTCLDDNGPPLALSEEQLERLNDRDVKTLIRLLEKAVGDTPDKQKRPTKPKLFPWQYDHEKMLYMTEAQEKGYRRKVDAERRARGFQT